MYSTLRSLEYHGSGPDNQANIYSSECFHIYLVGYILGVTGALMCLTCM